MRQGNKIWTWVGVFMLVVLIAAGCAAAPGTGGAVPAAETIAPTAETVIPAAGGGNGDVVEGWGGGYQVEPPELCPPVEDDAEVDKRVQQPIYFQEQLGTGTWNGSEVLKRRGLSANEQGEIFGLVVAGAYSDSSEEAIRAYSDALRICLDQILTAGISDKMAEDKVESPVADADAQASSDEEIPDPKQVAAESLVIDIWSIGFVTEGEVPGDKLGDILKDIVNGDVSGWESALSDLVKQKLDLQFISTTEKSKTSPDSVFDFIIDPRINNGVRHQEGFDPKRIAVAGEVERPGVTLLLEAERALKHSKRVLLALSNQYFDDPRATFDFELTQHLQVKKQEFRLLPVIFASGMDESLIPDRMDIYTRIDLSERTESRLQRLVKELKSPLPTR